MKEKVKRKPARQYWSQELVTIYKAKEHDRINAVLDILKGNHNSGRSMLIIVNRIHFSYYGSYFVWGQTRYKPSEIFSARPSSVKRSN